MFFIQSEWLVVVSSLNLFESIDSDRVLLLAADLGLGLLPEGLQFADAASLKVAAQGGLDPGEAIEEAVVGAGQA